MNGTAETFLTPYVVTSLVIVVSGQLVYALWLRHKKKRIAKKRAVQGLPPDILMNHSERLADRRGEAMTHGAILLVTVSTTPFLVFWFFSIASTPEAKTGLTVAFVALLIWVLVNGIS